jgi:peptide chain release factor subunit 1
VQTVVQPGRDQLRRLAQLRVEEGCVLSVYVDLDPSQFATAPARSSALTSAADEASRAVEEERREMTHSTRLGLREDIARIRDYAKQADFDSTHGLAIFAAAGARLFEPLHLPRSVANLVRVDGSPHVAPLVGHPNGSWCVALVTRRDARLLLGGPTGLGPEAERIDDDVPGRHDQGGLSQSRYERHIDEQARQHLKRVAKRLAELRRDGSFDHLLVGGTEQGYSEFAELLDNETRARLCGRLSVDVEHVSVAEVADAAAPLMLEHEQRRRQQLLDRVDEGLGPDGHAAAGLDEVVACLNEQRVATLMLDADLAVSGAQCPACGWLSTNSDGACPADGSVLRRRDDLVEPAIDRALAQDAEILRLRDEARTDAHAGVAALLRF